MVQLILLIVPLPLVGFWFWMFRDLTKNDYLSSDEKNDWTLKFILLNVLAAFWYYLVEYRNRYL
jgi:hypothetical protein